MTTFQCQTTTKAWSNDGMHRYRPFSATKRHPLPRVPSHRLSHTSQKRICRAEALSELIQGITDSLALETPGLLAGTAFNTTVFVLGIKVLLAGLTWPGVINSWLLGALVFSAFGWPGYLLVCLYFLLGSAVTKVKLAQKQAEGIAEARSGRRGVGSVWGSGLAGTICAALALATGNYHLFKVGFIASFASKLSDTVSSEIGKAYGKTTYLVTTFQLVPRGTEGAVSLEGTAAGLAAAVVYATLAVGLGMVGYQEAGMIVAAATVANFAESWLGATAQGNVEWLTNDVVNILQTCLAAVLAIGSMHFL